MISDAIKAAGNYFEALRLISELRLWKYVILPGLLSVILASILLGSIYIFSGGIGAWILDLIPWSVGSSISSAAAVISGLIMFVGGMLVLKYVVLVMVGPFMSPLSERIEAHLTGNQVGLSALDLKTNFKLMIRGLRLAVRNIIREILIVIPLVILGFFPIVGAFTGILIFLVQSFYAGFGNMDFTLERYYKVNQSIKFAKANRGIAIGNGAVFLLLFMIPIVGFFLAPALATVAGTISCLDRLDDRVFAPSESSAHSNSFEL